MRRLRRLEVDMQLLLELAFLGGGFSGYQVQPGKRTVQSVVQDAIEALYGKRYDVRGCSRTDSGVHANRFYITFFPESEHIPVSRIPDAFNAMLPHDISVNSAREVPDRFHVRYDVIEKTYVYIIHDSRLRDPFLYGRAWELKRTIDDCGVRRMRAAATHICGRHNFSAFMASGSSIEDPVRCVSDVSISREGGLLKIAVTADGFLYNMVRIIVGTLVKVAAGKLDPDEIDDIIQSHDRTRAGETAPACGLYLDNVRFAPSYLYSDIHERKTYL